MIENRFDDLFSYESLYKGHLKGRLSKRDRRTLVRFEMMTLANVYEVFAKMKNGQYRIGNYSRFIVKEPKTREIQTLHYSDRIVQHVICDEVLAPYFSERAIIDNCVCQVGKGMHFALKRFEEKLRVFARKNKQKGYILKCDILKYFPTIPHGKLKEIICKHIKDPKLSHFVEEIIDSYHTDIEFLNRYNIKPLYEGEDKTKTGRGVPIGNQTSQVFGMFYLDKIDRVIKEKLGIKIYSRYMDDFILVHEDKNTILKAWKEIQKVIEELQLTLNTKTQMFPVKNGVTYLGFKYHITETGKVVKRVKKKTIKRFKDRAKLLNRAFYDGAINEERVCQTMIAYHGHLKHANCFKLEKQLFARIKVKLDKDDKIQVRIRKILKRG